jgi:hypothetical protein
LPANQIGAHSIDSVRPKKRHWLRMNPPIACLLEYGPGEGIQVCVSVPPIEHQAHHLRPSIQPFLIAPLDDGLHLVDAFLYLGVGDQRFRKRWHGSRLAPRIGLPES